MCNRQCALVIKIGHVPETHRAVQLVEALDGVLMVCR